MLNIADLTAYLRARGITEPIYRADDPQEMPDSLIYLGATGGPGEARERAFELATFQVRARGQQNDPASAEALSGRVDAALMDVSYPQTFGARHVVRIMWVGGPPAIVGQDDARRSECACNYLADLAWGR